MTIRAVLVAPADLNLWLPAISPHLARIVAEGGGRYRTEDVIAAVHDGRVQLWAVVGPDGVLAVLTTEFIAYPRQRACRFTACVGKRWRAWAHVVDDIRAWARGQGCARMEAMAHLKYRHLLAGYAIDHVLFAREC